jgi:hypothetical protein
MILLEIQTKSLFNMFEMKGLRQKIWINEIDLEKLT